MPTLTFAPSKRPLRVRRRVHGGARTSSDARCPSGGGVSRSYALAASLPRPTSWHPGSRSQAYQRYAAAIRARMDKADFLRKQI